MKMLKNTNIFQKFVYFRKYFENMSKKPNIEIHKYFRKQLYAGLL